MNGEQELRIQQAGELIRSARFVVALTGAGISTPSGIPDFRSAGSGLWSKSDPMQVASLTAFRLRPKVFFDWLRPLAKAGMEAQPNPAHAALAQLEAAGKLRSVITQNIDGLHQRAGSQRVLEIHGSMETLRCAKCKKVYPAADFWDAFILAEGIPHCPTCTQILKPDVVLYEEMLPERVWIEAEQDTRRADLMIVIGSSLEVGPVNMLPYTALQNGAKLIIITRSATYLDDYADLLLPYEIAETVPAVAAAALMTGS